MNRIGDNLVHCAPNKEIIREFSNNSVDFIVVGGLAVAWYCKTRQADDMDLLVKPTNLNSERIYDALNRLGQYFNNLTKNSFARTGCHLPLKNYYYADILTPRVADPTYAKFIEEANNARLFGIPVRIVSREMLIQMKEIAAADSKEKDKKKDLADVEYLKQISSV